MTLPMRRSPLSWALLVPIVFPLAAAAWLLADAHLRTALFFNTAVVAPEIIDLPPAGLVSFRYRGDAPAEMSRFLPRAHAAVASATTDLERIQAIGDSVYRARRISGPRLEADAARTVDEIAAAIDQGNLGQCGHLTWLMTAMARALDIETRQVVWTRSDGISGHVSFEFFSREESRWIYFDVNMNGYATREGRALSARELRARSASGSGITPVSTPGLRTWDEATFRSEHAAHAFDWYVMSNGLDRFSPGRRFGQLRGAYNSLMRLPYSGVRIADRVLTGRDTRLAPVSARQAAGVLPAPIARRKRART